MLSRHYLHKSSVLLLYLLITNKDLLYSTGNSPQCSLAAWMGGEFGGEWIQCLCMTESLSCSPETITASLALKVKKQKQKAVSVEQWDRNQ